MMRAVRDGESVIVRRLEKPKIGARVRERVLVERESALKGGSTDKWT